MHHLAALKPKGKEKGQTLGEPLSHSAGTLADTWGGTLQPYLLGSVQL